jgi:NAD(P)H dehydrogenase (quinone)
MYGHVEKLAEEIKKGAASVEGVEAKLWQVRMCITYQALHAMSFYKLPGIKFVIA